MTKILYVYGDAGFAAATLEGDFSKDIKDFWSKSFEEKTEIEFSEGMFCKAYLFGEIDPKFLKALRNWDVIDYDVSKDANFYIVED